MHLKELMSYHKTKIKIIGGFTAATSLIWCIQKYIRTLESLNHAIDPSILEFYEPLANSSEDIPHTPVWVNPAELDAKKNFNFLSYFKFMYARRLLSVALSGNTDLRLRAVKNLSNLHLNNEWQYSLIAHMCDARTAVGIARTAGAEPEFFLPPVRLFTNYNDYILMHLIKDYLNMLDDNSERYDPCVSYTISKVFMELNDTGRIIDQDHGSVEVSVVNKCNLNEIPTCLNTILHHSMFPQYSANIKNNNGLYLLMEVYNRYKEDTDVCITMCNIVANLCTLPDMLEEVYRSGWITVLAKWLKSPDLRLSGPAAQALANLDRDDMNDHFSSNIYLLYPMQRSTEKVAVDVVFVHGLLGNVFYTWRNQSSLEQTLDFIGKKTGGRESVGLDASNSQNDISSERKSSDPVMQEFLEKMEEYKQLDWDLVGSGFEFVYSDLPENDRGNAKGPFSSAIPPDEDNKPTQCWAKDWLPKDCANIRVLGVNYDTMLSNWTNTCPKVQRAMSLDRRSRDLIGDLVDAGVGKRPIVWVTHSMGGLIIKNLLAMVNEGDDENAKNICKNSKAIFFYSTPHFGSKVASLNVASTYLVLPSIDVQELREGSANLQRIHENFLTVLKSNHIDVYSIVETKPTLVSTLKLNINTVEPYSGNPGVGEYFEVPQNHLTICKPSHRYSFLYQKVLEVVKQTVKNSNRKSSRVM